ncbi:MAG: hypothetical protein MJ211_14760 [Bacteroidales bacterium]|nr:hypothetical protein [Bacteroidales bacterium]
MKKVLLTIMSIGLAVQCSIAQTEINNSAKESGWSYKIQGFIDPQVHYDTREIVSGREEQMLFYPAPKNLDADGNDLNAKGSLNMLTITARIGMKINAPDMLGAKVFGYIEGDYTGSTNDGINMLRLRHAYVDMKWDKDELLVGQYWHPMVAHEVMPGTRPLNMGVPFHPYSRYVQTKYTRYFNKIELNAIAAFQLDNKAVGPNGASTEYLRNSCLPELNAQLVYRGDNVYLGAMYNYVLIQPRTFTTDNLGAKHKTDTKIGSSAFSIFGKILSENLDFRFQAIYGDNFYEQCLIGGYIETPKFNSSDYSYKNFGTTTIWADFSKRTGVCRPGIFVGFGKNNSFGDDFDNSEMIYGRGIDINNLYRIQPRIGFYPTKALNFFVEYELTTVDYGKRVDKMNNLYYYESDYKVSNSRFIMAVVFNF